MSNEANEYRGYSLFNDVEDKELRNYNRGQVMANIALSNQKGDSVSAVAANDLFNYFNLIDASEREEVLANFRKRMEEEGYAVELQAKTVH